MVENRSLTPTPSPSEYRLVEDRECGLSGVITEDRSSSPVVEPICSVSDQSISPTVEEVDQLLLYTIDGVAGMPTIPVYNTCMKGSCSCLHYIGNNIAQLKPCRFASYISGSSCNVFPHQPEMAKYIWEGVLQGFKIIDDDCTTSYACNNYNSILDPGFYSEMCSIISEELREGLVSKVPTRPQCVHAMGGVPKSNGKLRPITDCSMPEKISINNYMKDTFVPFSYKSVNNVVEVLEKGNWMAVVDLKSAFRSVNVYAPHTRYQGFSWDMGQGSEWYQSNRLCFGLRCAPSIFDALSNFIVRIAKGYGVERLVNYLDDFIIIADSADECLRQRNLLIEVMEFLGFVVSREKVTEPSRKTTFLGITINSRAMELTLPAEKIVKLKASLNECLSLKRAPKKLLQQIGGFMSFCSQIVRGGRTFSRRLFDLCARCRQGGSVILNNETRLDLEWWLQFCEIFNCRSLIRKPMYNLPMVSDASKRGFGAWMGDDYFYGFWKPNKSNVRGILDSHREFSPSMDNIHVHEDNINIYELWPVLVGMKR